MKTKRVKAEAETVGAWIERTPRAVWTIPRTPEAYDQIVRQCWETAQRHYIQGNSMHGAIVAALKSLDITRPKGAAK